MWDGYQERDTVTFAMFRLGQNLEDRFAFGGWLYIDTAARSMYEYDIENDSLIRWRK
jgi:hypothetical protein